MLLQRVRGNFYNPRLNHIYQTPVDNTSVWGSLGVFVWRGSRWPPKKLQQLPPSNFTANSHHPNLHVYLSIRVFLDVFKFAATATKETEMYNPAPVHFQGEFQWAVVASDTAPVASISGRFIFNCYEPKL